MLLYSGYKWFIINIMKRSFAVLLIIALVFSMSGCSDTEKIISDPNFSMKTVWFTSDPYFIVYNNGRSCSFIDKSGQKADFMMDLINLPDNTFIAECRNFEQSSKIKGEQLLSFGMTFYEDHIKIVLDDEYVGEFFDPGIKELILNKIPSHKTDFLQNNLVTKNFDFYIEFKDDAIYGYAKNQNEEFLLKSIFWMPLLSENSIIIEFCEGQYDKEGNWYFYNSSNPVLSGKLSISDEKL